MVKQKDWKRLAWVTKITEAVVTPNSSKKKDVMTISGVAIGASESRNGITYIPSELEKAAKTLQGKPLMMDHSGSVKDIVGRITSAKYNALLEAIEFEASVMEPKIQEMINDGRITDVSIGAIVGDLAEQKDGMIYAINIEFLELSLVAIPGIVDQGITSINQAIEQSLVLKEKVMGKAKFQVEKIDLSDIKKIGEDVQKLKLTLTKNSEIKSIEVRL